MGREKQLPGIRYGFRLFRVVKHFSDILVCEGHAKAEKK